MSKISSQTCNAMNIAEYTLEKCTYTTTDKYCQNHQHRYRLDKPDECSVCLDDISHEKETPFECGHWIHKKCIIPTNLHKCPVCQYKLNHQEIVYIFGENHIEHNHYDDGNSIYWNHQQEQNDEDNEDLEDEDIDGELHLNLSFIDECLFQGITEYYRSEINDAFIDLRIHMNYIMTEIQLNYRTTRFIEDICMLVFIPLDETEDFELFQWNMIAQTVNFINVQTPLNCNTREMIERLENHIKRSYIGKLFKILYNMKMIEDEWMFIYRRRMLNLLADLMRRCIDFLRYN